MREWWDKTGWPAVKAGLQTLALYAFLGALAFVAYFFFAMQLAKM